MDTPDAVVIGGAVGGVFPLGESMAQRTMDGNFREGGDMDGIFANLQVLEAAAISRVDRWSEKEQQSKEQHRLAGEEKRLAMKDLQVIRQTMAEMPESRGGDGESADSPQAIAVAASADAARQVGMGHEGPPWVFNRPFFRFLPPTKDPATGEPVYDSALVREKRSNRQRAYAVARVHGPEVRESSLAEAIYATGETNAADATSVRSSLGALVRYGNDWRRESGWLVYRHDDLEPDMEMIKRLVEQRKSSGPESDDN